MLQTLASLLGLGILLASAAAAAPAARSGKLTDNAIYDLLFCDEAARFKPQNGQAPAPWQTELFAADPDAAAIRAIAEDETAESRVRLLAFNWLREHGHPVPPRRVLGVIVEAPVDGGVDVLAAYEDGRVRYINHTGKMSIFESAPANVAEKAKAVVASAIPAVNQIGPWNKKRLPPSMTDLRITMLASDGLYFGQGSYEVMLQDPKGGPIFDKALALLLLVVDKATERTNSSRRVSH